MTTSAQSHHWKLGLFVVLSFVLLVATFAFLGATRMKSEGLRYVSYFDESVQGLERGSAVKYRGVTVGTVAESSVAPDRRHVEVIADLSVEALEALGLRSKDDESPRVLPTELRVQLASTGITGTKFVLIDFFDPALNPPPELPFPVPPNYVPSAPSLLKNLEDSLTRTAYRLPDVADDMALVLAKLNRILDSLEDRQLGDRMLVAIENTNALLDETRAQLRGLDAAGLSREAKTTFRGLNDTVGRMSRLLE